MSIPVFHCGVLETAAGPTIGAVTEALELALKARDVGIGKIIGDEAKEPWTDALNLIMNNNPVFHVNLFYTRPALDYLFLNSMREAASPGYLKRKERKRLRDYGQTYLLR